MYKPKLGFEVGKILKSGLSKLRAYNHGIHGSSAIEQYSGDEMTFNSYDQKTQNRLEADKGLALAMQMLERKKYG